MPLARPIVFGNWKMYGLRADSRARAEAVAGFVRADHGTVGIFPPFTVLREVVEVVGERPVVVGGQDCHDRPEGAFTGSISPVMLRDAGATAVIVGHSERRHGLGEDDAFIRRKAEAALAAGLLVVLCIGETEAEYLAGRRHEVLERQLEGSLPTAADGGRLVIAYEPVWAIGTGRTPTLEEIREIHGWLRQELARRRPGGSDIPLLYGGSVKPANAAGILAQPDVDGVLVGGASLDPEAFRAIYEAGDARR